MVLGPRQSDMNDLVISDSWTASSPPLAAHNNACKSYFVPLAALQYHIQLNDNNSPHISAPGHHRKWSSPLMLCAACVCVKTRWVLAVENLISERVRELRETQPRLTVGLAGLRSENTEGEKIPFAHTFFFCSRAISEHFFVYLAIWFRNNVTVTFESDRKATRRDDRDKVACVQSRNLNCT